MAAAARSAALLEHLSELGCTQAAAIRPERLAWLYDQSADSGAGSGVIELLDAIVAKVGPQNSLVCSLTQAQREAYERLRMSASTLSTSAGAGSSSLAGGGGGGGAATSSEPLLQGDELAAAEDSLRDMAPQLTELEDEANTRRAAIAALREKRHALDTRLSAVRARNHTLAERAKKLDGQVPAARDEAASAAALVRETSTTLDEALQQLTRRVDDVLRDSLGRLQEDEDEGEGDGRGNGKGEEDEPSRSPQFLSLGADLRRYLRLEDAHTREINAYVNTALRPKPTGSASGGASGSASGALSGGSGADAATEQAETTVRWQLKSAALEQPRWLHELDVEALGKHGSSAAAGRYDFHCVELYRLCEDQRPKSEAALLEARTELARAQAAAASVSRRAAEQRALVQLAPHELTARLAT